MTEFECSTLPVDAVAYIPENYLEQISEHLFIDHRTGALLVQEVDAVIRIAGPGKD